MEKKLELRMYGLVPYNISPIQQAIQFGHGVVEYGQKMKRFISNGIDSGFLNLESALELNDRYDDWANNWKTFIILNGGTTSTNINTPGTLNVHLQTLRSNDILFSEFYEPDLGDQLTSVNFIVDERVFNKKDYPDFVEWYNKNITMPYSEWLESYGGRNFKTPGDYAKFTESMLDGGNISSIVPDAGKWNEWVNLIGGQKNLFLRKFLSNFRLA